MKIKINYSIASFMYACVIICVRYCMRALLYACVYTACERELVYTLTCMFWCMRALDSVRDGICVRWYMLLWCMCEFVCVCIGVRVCIAVCTWWCTTEFVLTCPCGL